jgi:hypothetical protein
VKIQEKTILTEEILNTIMGGGNEEVDFMPLFSID